ncbi:hypothetical protein PR202_ga28668 [Eleusine coracana subsp. coracana]|uniref:Peroxidase n=1 Tax=Eleusine coracana subsp. coracana TaxID=191504 RepID=A0AAV5DJ49_ELECO|nr:hypothetical protein QOZ80_7AG0552440 [Eleusine coracana subsp. coracana]GJN10563.1 hypothetical protein PR202_ga28668 [Eleusine coracana subsp. coracana]
MATAAARAAVVVVTVVTMVVSVLPGAEGHLQMGAYNKTCPQAEEIVLKEMSAILGKTPDLAGPVLRLFSVDCFVGGCEGSILLDSTPNNTAEKDSPLNKGVRGYEVVDAIKAKLDEACPGVVSCADTLALAARDSIRLSKGPFIPLLTGREDGNRSVAADVAANTPAPGANITDLIAQFAKLNLTAKDLAVLSGAHTIGKARCSTISPRLYGGQNGSSSSDPTLDGNYTTTLRGQCKPGDESKMVDLDPTTPTTFDGDYYKLVAGNRGLLSTDAALLLDPATKAYVSSQANNATSDDGFFADFAVSFLAMSKIGALTHHKGEIRNVCSKVNPPSPPHNSNNAAARTYLNGGLLLLTLAAPLLLGFLFVGL